MALRKKIINENGIPIEYWNIGRINLDKIGKCCNIVINGYVNQETKVDYPIPVDQRNVLITRNEFDEVFGATEVLDSNIYEFIKQNEEFFKDAEDVLEEE